MGHVTAIIVNVLTVLLRIAGTDQHTKNIQGSVSEMMKKTLLKAKWKVSSLPAERWRLQYNNNITCSSIPSLSPVLLT